MSVRELTIAVPEQLIGSRTLARNRSDQPKTRNGRGYVTYAP
jgi:hypothetical protein